MLTKLAVELDTKGNAAYSYLVDAIVNGNAVWPGWFRAQLGDLSAGEPNSAVAL